MYNKGILQLPTSSLTQEFMCTKVRTELLLSGNKDAVVREVAPYPTQWIKWNPRVAFQEAEAAADIVGKFQFGLGGLGLGSGKPVWNKAGSNQKRTLVMEQILRQEEMIRDAKAVAQAKQG